jgi:hypothetical protein
MLEEVGRKITAAICETPITSLIPIPGNPFYIISPPYARISSAATVLHLLCHYLNMSGEAAYMVTLPALKTPLRSLPHYVSLQTKGDFPAGMQVPSVTQEVFTFYDEQKITPIVIYPENFDNPLKANFFGRYILNYPGRLAPAYREREHFSIAYSKTLADYCTDTYPDHPQTDDVLYVPTSDLRYWNTRGAAERRRGVCYYARKLQEIHGKTPANVPEGATEILRGDKMSRDQVRELFWKSETFYCYEDSALATEALLCGCPTAFVPNEHFSGVPLTANELTTDGWWIGHGRDGLDRARTTVHKVEARVHSYMFSVPGRIRELAEKWKEMARQTKYERPVCYPLEPRLVFFEQKIAPSSVLSGKYIVTPDASFTPGASSASDAPSTPDAPSAVIDRRSPLARRILFPILLVSHAYRDRDERGVIGRIVKGLRRYGPVGFLKLLAGLPVTSN